jgi:hypothetical protein
MMATPRYEIEVSGGCQCGAVRYHTTEMYDNAHVCHCRMCQKAAGNLFMSLVSTPRSKLVWTRGTPARFRSSEHVERGYCRDCGTPLFYQDARSRGVSLTIGSMDHPELFPPKRQEGIESRIAFVPHLHDVPDGGTTEGEEGADNKWADAIRSSNHQHPDHDTDVWPVERSG